MEYKKDKRIKNLSLYNIHVGNWVQVWSETAERYSPPLKIIQICDDGTIYLVTSDEERPTPWEENIKNVDVLPITSKLLGGFGFKLEDKKAVRNGYVEEILYDNINIGHLYTYSNGRVECYSAGEVCVYMHNLCNVLAIFFPTLKLEWKGIEK